MSKFYRCFRLLSERWLWGAMSLVFATLATGLYGFAQADPAASWSSICYQTLQLFDLGAPADARFDTPCLDVARWMGALVWSFTILTLLLGLFRQPVIRFLVQVLARNHVVILADGVRDNLVPLIQRLRTPTSAQPKPPSVVIVSHRETLTSWDECRALGAICMEAGTIDIRALTNARIDRATAVVILGENDRDNANIVDDVYRMLQDSDATRPTDMHPLAPNRPSDVSCMMQVNQPELVEVLRRHIYHENPADRLRLRLFNRQEMAARAMLRETGLPELRKILVVGLGAEARLADSLIARAIKDQKIENPAAGHLEIHVIDEGALAWSECFTHRNHYLGDVSGIMPVQRTAAKCGFSNIDRIPGLALEKYDAVFVCLANESLAVSQAVRIADELRQHPDMAATPVVVAVQDESSSFGAMLSMDHAGGLGANLHPVGIQSRLDDVIVSRHPVAELLAQVLHQDYLALHQHKIAAAPDSAERTRLLAKPAYRPWPKLEEKFKESNRQLAYRLSGMLEVQNNAGQVVRRFRMVFAPFELIEPQSSYQLNADELERLARQEHNNWMAAASKLGWRFGNPQTQPAPAGITYNQNMVEWDKLDDDTRDYDRNIIRRLPYILAKADYKLVEV